LNKVRILKSLCIKAKEMLFFVVICWETKRMRRWEKFRCIKRKTMKTRLPICTNVGSAAFEVDQG